jgi:hypothetical protein
VPFRSSSRLRATTSATLLNSSRSNEKRLVSGTLGAIANAGISADGRRIAVTNSNGIGVLDATSGESLWHHECEKCLRIRLSENGTRVLTWSEKRLELWDIAQREPIWSESSRVGRATDAIDLSKDGQLALWARDSSLFVHSVGDGSDTQLQLDDAVHSASFSYDRTRIAVVGFSTIGLWAVGQSRALWQVRNFSSVFQDVYWSIDDSALIVNYDALGTSLLDSETGERFANLTVTKPGAFATQEIALPSLRYRISQGDVNGKCGPCLLPITDRRARAWCVCFQKPGSRCAESSCWMQRPVQSKWPPPRSRIERAGQAVNRCVDTAKVCQRLLFPPVARRAGPERYPTRFREITGTRTVGLRGCRFFISRSNWRTIGAATRTWRLSGRLSSLRHVTMSTMAQYSSRCSLTIILSIV